MTNTKSAGEVDAREAAVTQPIHIAYNAAMSVPAQRTAADTLFAQVDAAIDAYLTSTRSQDPRVEEIRAELKTDKAVFGSDIGADRLKISYLLEINSTLIAKLKEAETFCETVGAENAHLSAQQCTVDERARELTADHANEMATLQSDKDRLTKALEFALPLVEKWCHTQGNTTALRRMFLGPIEAALSLPPASQSEGEG